MAKISIIVPVYNVEKYLSRCIESILNQSITDLEIILVNDGSKDSSGKICDQYAERDSRIKVIHKINEGPSVARNIGIECSSGSYIGFVDSDDYIAEDMYEVLLNNIEKENADISMCDLIHCYEGEVISTECEKEYCVWDSKEAIKVVMEAKKTSVTPVNKLYKRELFEQIRYPKDISSGEDGFVIIDLLLISKKVVFTSEKKYYYIHRKNSITTSEFNEKDLDVIKVYQKNYQVITERYPELEETAKMRCMWADFYVLDKWMISNKYDNYDVIKKIIKELRKNYVFILKNKCFNNTRKMAMSLLMINQKLYKICVCFSKKRYMD